jgi:hypothetical protein
MDQGNAWHELIRQNTKIYRNVVRQTITTFDNIRRSRFKNAKDWNIWDKERKFKHNNCRLKRNLRNNSSLG